MREREYIIKTIFTIVYYCGIIMVCASVILLLPLLILPFWPEELKYSWCFILPAASSAAVGGFIILFMKDKQKITMDLIHGAVIVVFAWAYTISIGAVPLALMDNMNYLLGLFESISGWTGTGLTVMVPEKCPHVILLWRSLSQYLGGAGFALIMMSVLSGTSATSVYHVEGHPHEIFPNVKKSASIIFKIYLLYLFLGSASLTIAGMPLFDSVNHTMCALGTGGFSTKNLSIGFYNSIPINIICILIMYAGSMSFTSHNFLLKGKFNIVKRNVEFKTSLIAIGSITVLTALAALYPLYKDMGKAFMTAAFETVSSMSGTGFSITDYTVWPSIGIFLNIIAMCIGGQTNSTSGALKQLRVAIIFKSVWWLIRQQFLPRNVVETHYIYKGEEKIFIKSEHVQEVFMFAGIYVMSLLFGSGLLMAMGVPMQSAFFEFSSAQGCVGQSIGVTSPSAQPGILLTLMYGMFFGRLEFLVIFYAVIKVFKDIGVLISKEA
ncbi:MAG: hypothetical protein LWY06_03005 [Firmicutes bacterium]|nr:hypothetical protein [Bacillota bacterium]